MPSNEDPRQPANFAVFGPKTLEPRRPPHPGSFPSHPVTRLPREIILVKEYESVKNLPSVWEDSPRLTLEKNISDSEIVGMAHRVSSQDIAYMGPQELLQEKPILFTHGLSKESYSQMTNDVQERNIIVHQKSPPQMTKVVQERNIIVHQESSPPMTKVVKKRNIIVHQEPSPPMPKVVQEIDIIVHQESSPQTTKESSPLKTSILHQLSFP